MLRKRFKVAAAVTAAALAVAALAACAPTSSSSEDSSTLTLAVSGRPPSLDPALQASAGDLIWRWHAVYDTLLRCDEDGNVGPAAAESFELSEDATTLTMKMREGMTFSDGSPVDAAAAVASIQHMQTGGGSDAGRVSAMTVEATDDMTVVLTAPEPTGQLPTFMCFAPGIVASPSQIDGPDVGTDVISSGPYELVKTKTTTGSVYTYEKRDDYWDADSYPYENLEIKIMPDVNARLNALRSNQVQGAVIDQATAKQAESAGLHVLKQVSAWSGLVIADRTGETVPALGDVRVRQAINMVFDREAIAKGLFAGDAAPTSQIFTPNETAYVESLEEKYPFDVEAAKALMADAGYADGFTVQIPSVAGDDGTVSPTNPLIVQQLALLNITVEQVTLSGPTAQDRILGGDFPMFHVQLGTADSLFDIVQSLQPGSIWNVKKTEDPELAPLLSQAQTLQGDEADANFQAINEYVVDQAWYAPWVTVPSYFALTSEEIAPTQTDQFHLIPNLWDFR
ncbi:ABC transporter substrate-binding protein [Microbacterium sp.]|uniref:ABC transporter substrate-binding protein n=1 Tax=Microbacterium sp. TaxID=51671 RepID=UPI003566C024